MGTVTRRAALGLIGGSATMALVGCCKESPPCEPTVVRSWQLPPEGTQERNVVTHRVVIGMARARKQDTVEQGRARALADLRRLVGVDGYRNIIVDYIQMDTCDYYRAIATPVTNEGNDAMPRVSHSRDLQPWNNAHG